MIERAVVVCEGNTINLSDLQGRLCVDDPFLSSLHDDDVPSKTIALYDMEKEHIIRVFTDKGHSMTKTAVALGISRTTLWRKMHNLGIKGSN
jgi:transcriptional regulator of acetoin/glycerol metabolism